MNGQHWSCVLLDMDGTFFDFPSCERRAFFLTMEAFDIQADETMYQTYRAINQAAWKELEAGKLTHEQLRPERFRRLMAQLGRTFPHGVTAEQVAAYNVQRIAEGGILYDGARELWKRIYQKYRVCVLTNGSDLTQYNRLKCAGLLEYTHAVVTSQRAGAGKPNAAMFRLALVELGCPDESECVMVGDSLEADIQGAKNFGIDTIWYNPTKIRPENIQVDKEVQDYSALAAALELER